MTKIAQLVVSGAQAKHNRVYRRRGAAVRSAAPLLALFALAPAVPAHAAGEILITHAKALAGNVTPGDTPGYPIHLTLPGNYQFSGNLSPTPGSMGIAITSSNVTIDLNGFRMHGSGTAYHGIVGGVDSVIIRNGTVTGFRYDGINGTGRFWSIEDVRVVSNGRRGILVGGDAHIGSSTIAGNGLRGVTCGNSCLVERNIVASNGSSFGIRCEYSCHAEGNVVSFNSIGISLGDGFALGNTVSRNVSYGIVGDNANTTAYGNNALVGNNQLGPQALQVDPLHANYCYPGPCP